MFVVAEESCCWLHAAVGHLFHNMVNILNMMLVVLFIIIAMMRI